MDTLCKNNCTELQYIPPGLRRLEILPLKTFTVMPYCRVSSHYAARSGLNLWLDFVQSSEIEDYDYTILEVSRFCDLLVAGDPKCVEALFIHPTATYFIADEFMQLTVHRLVFLTRLVTYITLCVSY
jgi:hypothetical protein